MHFSKKSTFSFKCQIKLAQLSQTMKNRLNNLLESLNLFGSVPYEVKKNIFQAFSGTPGIE